MPDTTSTPLIPKTALSVRQRILIWLGPIEKGLFTSLRDMWTYGKEKFRENTSGDYFHLILNTLNMTDLENLRRGYLYPRSNISRCWESISYQYEEINSEMELIKNTRPSSEDIVFMPEIQYIIDFILKVVLYLPIMLVTIVRVAIVLGTFPITYPLHRFMSFFNPPVDIGEDCLEGKRPKKNTLILIANLLGHLISLTPLMHLLRQTLITVAELILQPINTFKKFVRYCLETNEERKYRAETQIVEVLLSVVSWGVDHKYDLEREDLLELLNKLELIQIESAMKSVKLASWILESLNNGVSFINGGCPRQKALLRGVEKHEDPIKTGLKVICDQIGMTQNKLTDNARDLMIQDTLNASSLSSLTSLGNPDASNLICILENPAFSAASLEQRKIYCHGHRRNVYDALLTVAQRRDLEGSEKRMLTALFESFTDDEKHLAVTPAGQNTPNDSPLVRAALNNYRGELIAWLNTMGVDIGVNPNGRIAGNQDVHNQAVNKTVSDSLNALKNSNKKLNSGEVKNALKSLVAFSKTLPDDPSSNEEDPVCRRALERLLSAFYSGVHDEASGVSAQEILAHFWHYYQKQSNEDKECSLATFKSILYTIQRGYSKDIQDSDRVICGGGTVNQSTIALQAVLPELIWVEVMGRNRLTLIALNWIAQNLDNAYKQASQNIQSASRNEISMGHTGLVPNALWNVFENDFREHLMKSLHNDALNRDCVSHPKKEIDELVAQLKSGRFNITREMYKMHNAIKDILQSFKRDTTHPNPDRFSDIHHLDKSKVADDEDDDDDLHPVRPVLSQYHLMRDGKQNIDHETQQAYLLLKYRNVYKSVLPEETLNALPEPFKALAQNEEFIKELLSRVDQKVKRLKLQGQSTAQENVKIPLDDMIPDTVSTEELLSALKSLNLEAKATSSDTLENDLLEQSPALFGAWLALSEVPAQTYKKSACLA